MGHPPRLVQPGDLFHGFNRTVGHRTLIDDDVDGRGFLALLAGLVHRDEIRVRAFCVMMTHFHLLLESVNGRLGDAMQRLEGIYARGFNRRHPPRDGHLLRARYRLKRVVSETYQSNLFTYFDQNPVVAGLVTNPADYPFGSACLYRRERGPAWLDRKWVESEVRRRLGLTTYTPEGYSRCFGLAGSPGQRQWLESLISSPAADTPSLDELVRASPEHVTRWLEERALDADGTSRRPPLADIDSITRAVAEAQSRAPDWTVRPRRVHRAAWPILKIGVLREVGGQSFVQAGARAAIAATSAAALYAEHRHLVATDATYRAIAAETTVAALRECHGSRTSYGSV